MSTSPPHPAPSVYPKKSPDNNFEGFSVRFQFAVPVTMSHIPRICPSPRYPSALSLCTAGDPVFMNPPAPNILSEQYRRLAANADHLNVLVNPLLPVWQSMASL